MEGPAPIRGRRPVAGGDPIARAQDGGLPDDLLAEEEQEVARIRKEGLERALKAEAAQLLEQPGAKPYGTTQGEILYKGTSLVLQVPRVALEVREETPAGVVTRKKYVTPPLYKALKQDPHGVERLIDAGVPVREVARTLQAAAPGKAPKGTSRSNVGRKNVEIGDQRLRELMSRPLGDKAIVAVMLDGTEIKEQTVMVAIGITAEGKKLALGVNAGWNENEALVANLLRDLLRRGLDKRVLWIADEGKGIRNGIELVTGSRDFAIQHCVLHKARRVVKHVAAKDSADARAAVRAQSADGAPPGERVQGQGLRKAAAAAREAASERFQESVRLRMYGAWKEPTPEAALSRLEGIAAELEEQGYDRAAASARTGIEETVTVTRLGLSGDVRRQLRTTNAIESINRWIKDKARDVTSWGSSSEMRLRWAAMALADLEAESWERVADPEALIAMNQRLAPGLHDLEAIRARVPPRVEVRPVLGRVDDPAGVRRVAAEWLAQPGRGVWRGSADALKMLGLRPGSEVSTEQLARTLQGQHVDATRVRPLARVAAERVDDQGHARKELVAGVACLSWSLTAPAVVSERWLGATPDERAAIERGMMRAAGAAVARLTHSTREGEGVAAAVMVSAEAADGSTAARLRVHGLVVGVKRGNRLVSPAPRATLQSATARHAEDAAKAELDAAIGVPRVVEQQAALAPAPAGRAPAPRPEPAFTDSLEEHRPVLGSRRAGKLDDDATVLGTSLRDRTDEWLHAKRDELGDPFGHLDHSGGRQTLRLERDREIAKRDLRSAQAQAPGPGAVSLERGAKARLETLAKVDAKLRDAGLHLDGWTKLYGRPAAMVVALEREDRRRELELGVQAPEQPAGAEVQLGPHEQAEHEAPAELAAADVDIGR